MTVLYHATQLPLFGTSKVCTCCKTELPLDCFARDKLRKDGHCIYCKTCDNAKRLARYRAKHIPAPKKQRIEPQGKRIGPRSVLKDGKRVCPKCNTNKPLKEFGIDTSRIDGHKYVCKICICKLAHARYIPQHSEHKLKPGKRHPLAREGFKICNVCNPPTEKPVSAFCKRKDTFDGLGVMCKACDNRKHHELSPEVAARNVARSSKWAKENPDRVRQHSNRRRGRKKNAQTSDVDYKRIMERDGYWCYICEQAILPHHKIHFDHVIPLTPRKGTEREPGPHCEENIKPTHMTCNCRKHNNLLSEMTPYQRRGPK